METGRRGVGVRGLGALVMAAGLAAVGVHGGISWGYSCPPRTPPRPRTFSLAGGAFELFVSGAGVARLSAAGKGRPEAGPAVVWRDVRLGFVPAWAVMDGKTRWLIAAGHDHGVKIVDPKGDVWIALPFRSFLTPSDLKKAGWKCGSWWAVGTRARFARDREGYSVRMDFSWGLVVRVFLPSGRISRRYVSRRDGRRRRGGR